MKRDFSSGPLLRSGSRERRREFPVQKRAVCFTYHAIKTPCHVVFQALAVVPRLSWRPCLLSWRCSSQQLCCTWARARARACAHTLARATRTSNTDSLERQRKAETDHSWRLRAVAILGPSASPAKLCQKIAGTKVVRSVPPAGRGWPRVRPDASPLCGSAAVRRVAVASLRSQNCAPVRSFRQFMGSRCLEQRDLLGKS